MVIPVLTVLCLAFSGCSSDSEGGTSAATGAGPDGETDAGGGASAPSDQALAPGTVTGVVTNDEILPLEGVEVGIREELFQATNFTDSGGRFILENMPAGPHTLFALKVGYEQPAIAIVVEPEATLEVEIVLIEVAVPLGFPTRLELAGITVQGGWFQIPYSEALTLCPEGFSPKPHVLLDPNGVTAEASYYVMSYSGGSLDGAPLGPGAWAFEVLSVVPPPEHARGSTVEFLIFGSFTSDPALTSLLGKWNLGTNVPATIEQALTSLGPDTMRGDSSVTADGQGFTLAGAGTGRTDAVAGTEITVRYFGVVDGAVINYVDVDLEGLAYQISGAAQLSTSGTLAFDPPVPAGEGYLQWGDEAWESLEFVPAG